MVLLDDSYIQDNVFQPNTDMKEGRNYAKDLTLQRRRITGIGVTSLCKEVIHAYLQDNKIPCIRNLKHMPKVRYLYLQNNNISSMSGIEHLKELKVLYIGSNQITVVEKLETSAELEELHIQNQMILPSDSLYFEPLSLQGIATSLKILDTAGNKIKSIEPFSCLISLEELDASSNDISNMENTCWALGCMRSLTTLDLSENPICRDILFKNKIIASACRLMELNGKKILEVHRRFYKAFENEKEKRHMSTEVSKEAFVKCSDRVQSLIEQLPTGVQLALKKSVAEEMNTKSEWRF